MSSGVDHSGDNIRINFSLIPGDTQLLDTRNDFPKGILPKGKLQCITAKVFSDGSFTLHSETSVAFPH